MNLNMFVRGRDLSGVRPFVRSSITRLQAGTRAGRVDPDAVADTVLNDLRKVVALSQFLKLEPWQLGCRGSWTEGKWHEARGTIVRVRSRAKCQNQSYCLVLTVTRDDDARRGSGVELQANIDTLISGIKK